MQPAVGVPLESRQEWHRNLEAAILHHSTALAKQPAISVVDSHGKVSVALTYGKLNTVTFSFPSSCNKQTNTATRMYMYTTTHKYNAIQTRTLPSVLALIYNTCTCTVYIMYMFATQLNWLEGLRRWLISCFENLEEEEQ